MKNMDLTIVSSYATDRLLDGKSGKVLKVQNGGPAFFLSKAIEKMGMQPNVYTGNPCTVEIQLYKDDEFGYVKDYPVSRKLPFLKTEFTIVSTILNEWTLEGIEAYKGKVFVDIQGYVRGETDFGSKKIWQDASRYAEKVFCLKGNESEMQFIPKNVLNRQRKERMLITTYGKKGVRIEYKGKTMLVTPPEVINPSNTIGAGDTFFANFVVKFIQTEDLRLSADFALQRTAEFLRVYKER